MKRKSHRTNFFPASLLVAVFSLILVFGCKLKNAPPSGAPSISNCTQSNYRYSCTTKSSYGNCLAYLAAKQVNSCEWKGHTYYKAVKANILENASLLDPGGCTYDPDTNPAQYLCPERTINQCLNHQRGGNKNLCTSNPQTLEELSIHATQEVQAFGDRTEESYGLFSIQFKRPSDPPMDPTRCDPTNPLGSCERPCHQLDVKVSAHPESPSFTLLRADSCEEDGITISTDSLSQNLGIDSAIEQIICRKYKELKKPSGQFTLTMIRPLEITGKYCFLDPRTNYTESENGWRWEYERDCEFLDKKVTIGFPYTLICNL